MGVPGVGLVCLYAVNVVQSRLLDILGGSDDHGIYRFDAYAFDVWAQGGVWE